MILTANKELTETQRKELALELSFGSFDGTLTEIRYDEIVELLFQYTQDADVRMGILSDGKPTWREKHFKRYNRQVF